MDGEFSKAAIAVFIAMILDTLDGRVARLTNSSSDFGAEFDSLLNYWVMLKVTQRDPLHQ